METRKTSKKINKKNIAPDYFAKLGEDVVRYLIMMDKEYRAIGFSLRDAFDGGKFKGRLFDEPKNEEFPRPDLTKVFHHKKLIAEFVKRFKKWQPSIYSTLDHPSNINLVKDFQQTFSNYFYGLIKNNQKWQELLKELFTNDSKEKQDFEDQVAGAIVYKIQSACVIDKKVSVEKAKISTLINNQTRSNSNSNTLEGFIKTRDNFINKELSLLVEDVFMLQKIELEHLADAIKKIIKNLKKNNIYCQVTADIDKVILIVLLEAMNNINEKRLGNSEITSIDKEKYQEQIAIAIAAHLKKYPLVKPGNNQLDDSLVNKVNDIESQLSEKVKSLLRSPLLNIVKNKSVVELPSTSQIKKEKNITDSNSKNKNAPPEASISLVPLSDSATLLSDSANLSSSSSLVGSGPARLGNSTDTGQNQSVNPKILQRRPSGSLINFNSSKFFNINYKDKNKGKGKEKEETHENYIRKEKNL